VEFRTRPKWRVLNDLIDRLETLPANHPDRGRLIRMILGLRGEIDGRCAPGPGRHKRRQRGR